MENHRLLLYFTLFFVIYLLWAEWQMDYGPKAVVEVPQASTQTVTESSDHIPQPDIAASTAAAIEVDKQPDTRSQRILVVTDVVEVEIDTRGGDVKRLMLRNYAVSADKPLEKLNLLTDADVNYHIAQSGLVSGKANTAPTHNAIYTAEQSSYRLAEGENEIRVPLNWKADDGTQVTKTFIFRRNDYAVDVNYNITAGNADWSGSQYMQLVRTPPPSESESTFIRTYTGGVVFNQDIKYEKIDFEDIAENNLSNIIGIETCKNAATLNQGCTLSNGWLAMIQHYFLAAWIPQTGFDNLYYARKSKTAEHYVLGTRSPAKIIKAGEQDSFSTRLVAGPKLQYKLEEMAPGLELTVDYGVLTIIAKPLFWLLNFFHGWFANWGWAIIFLTITVKAVFYKLSEMSYRSMAKMRKVAPRIKAMKERFGDDRQAMSKAMMEMYKREKINPMGGCFPILVQIPVFISLYWVLLESVEMRHAPFILWITNLSDMDPYFILPVIMGISMFVQQKLNPAPVDPVQQKIFQIMPFAFTIMFAFFPSGLVLYWVVNNLLSITQQYIITRRIENAD
jgi:YidC/Oxa1 family membrane protein insertase